MTRPDASFPARTPAALLSLAALLGGLAGLADALLTAARSAATGGLFLYAVSTGTALALAAAVLPALFLTALRRPRAPASQLAVVAALLVLSPAWIAIGRHLHRARPWDVVEGFGAIGAGLAVLAVAALAARAGRAVPLRVERPATRFLARALLPAALLALPAGARMISAIRPPGGGSGAPGETSLLLVTVDTLRPDALGVTGNPTALTPWMDRIARRAVLFPDCTASSPWTLPSLATVLTGAYPGEHLVLEALSGVSGSVTTMAEAASRRALRTAAFVSNPWLAPGGLERGFSTFDVAERLECLPEIRDTRIGAALTKMALRVGKLDRADRVVARGLRWIRGGQGGFLLWLHCFDPHLPNRPPRPHDRLFGAPPGLVDPALEVEEIRAGRAGGSEARAEIARMYDGEVAFTDRALGTLWRALEADDRLASTVIVLSADHGEEFWDHDGYGHGHAMWDEVVRVPLVVRPAGGGDGVVDPRPCGLVDLAPTALAAAGIAAAEGTFRGRNLLEHPGGVSDAYAEAVLYGPERKLLRAGRWKLVQTLPGAGRDGGVSLFDLERDPAEREDLSLSRPELLDSLRTVLDAWKEEVGSAGAMAAHDLPDGLDPITRDQLESLGYVP